MNLFNIIKMKIAVYPGTFDPITKGHLDLISRALKLVDKLFIAVADGNNSKHILFSAEERVQMIKQELQDNNLLTDKVRVEIFSGLLVNYARANSANISIRGIRVNSDFEYEFQMANMNFILDDKIETIFLPAKIELQLVSSKAVKEIVKLGGATNKFISQFVRQKLDEKYS